MTCYIFHHTYHNTSFLLKNHISIGSKVFPPSLLGSNLRSLCQITRRPGDRKQIKGEASMLLFMLTKHVIYSSGWKLMFANLVECALSLHNSPFVNSDIFIWPFLVLGKNYVNFPLGCLPILSHKLFHETWIQMLRSFSISFHHKFQSSAFHGFSVTIQSFYSNSKTQYCCL